MLIVCIILLEPVGVNLRNAIR